MSLYSDKSKISWGHLSHERSFKSSLLVHVDFSAGNWTERGWQYQWPQCSGQHNVICSCSRFHSSLILAWSRTFQSTCSRRSARQINTPVSLRHTTIWNDKEISMIHPFALSCVNFVSLSLLRQSTSSYLLKKKRSTMWKTGNFLDASFCPLRAVNLPRQLNSFQTPSCDPPKKN